MTKHRSEIYLVVREQPHVAVCSAYTKLEDADAAVAAENQRWKDKGWVDEDIFRVWVTTIYEDR